MTDTPAPPLGDFIKFAGIVAGFLGALVIGLMSLNGRISQDLGSMEARLNARMDRIEGHVTENNRQLSVIREDIAGLNMIRELGDGGS